MGDIVREVWVTRANGVSAVVPLSNGAVAYKLKRAIKEEMPITFSKFDACDIIIKDPETDEELADDEVVMPPECLRGTTKALAFIVEAPWRGGASRMGETRVQESGPSNPRRRRWDELNKCLQASNSHKSVKRRGGLTPFSSVKYNEVKDVFGPIMQPYEQAIKAIPDAELELLSQFLGRASNSIGEIYTGKEAEKRLYLIAPIIMVVCSLFNGGVHMKVHEEVIGKSGGVKACGHFEFLLQRGKKRVCIVEAKKDDMEQALADCLIGCEIVASNEDMIDTPAAARPVIVYGIVTSFISWSFLKRHADRIEREDRSPCIVEYGTADPAPLKIITGKIYAMLSDDD